MATMVDVSVGGDLGLFESEDMGFDLETELRIVQWQCLVLRVNESRIGV